MYLKLNAQIKSNRFRRLDGRRLLYIKKLHAIESVLSAHYIQGMSSTNRDKKAALFGAASVKKETTNGTPKAAVVTSVPRATVSSISPVVKAQKMKEAAELAQAGDDYLKTSIFKWSADHLGASNKFEGAATAYSVAGEKELAATMFEKAAKSHAGCSLYGAAANAFMSASKMFASLPSSAGVTRAVANLRQASDMWAMHGETFQAANCYISAGTLLETDDSAQAWEFYEQGRNLLCPENADSAQLKQSTVRGIDAMRVISKFLLKDATMLSNALIHAQMLVRLLSAFEQESSIHKTLASITIIQLHMRDFVSADKTFLEHLGVSSYCRSKECEVAESFLQAMKTLDAEALMKVQKSDMMQYLDRDIIPLASSLRLRSGTATASASASVHNVVRVELPAYAPEIVTAPRALEVASTAEVHLDIEVSETNQVHTTGGGEYTATVAELSGTDEAYNPPVSTVDAEINQLSLPAAAAADDSDDDLR